MSFKDVESRYNGPEIEQDMLKFWHENDIFEKSIQQSEGKPRFSFCEGPPTANGMPGIHHVLARTFKDIYPRYKTMRGYHAPRKAGWDTHGLPVEHQIEKELKIFDKKRIEEEVGVAEFTKRCRDSVMRYIGEWEKMTKRMGYWVNLDQAYYTLDNDYIESVWSLLKQIWDSGLIYQGYKVVPYDPRIGATLSSHELAQGYKEIVDPAITVRFRLHEDPTISFLAWTTTPWTIPAHQFLVVHPEIEYVYAKLDNETVILAKELLERVLGERTNEITKTIKGSELVGKTYQRPLDYLVDENPDVTFRVYPADFVTIEDGTGIVHCAPAYGAEEMPIALENNIPIVHGVGLDGYFKAEVTPVAGKFFKDADAILIGVMQDKGVLFKNEEYTHNYPHGWRTGDPIIYYAKNAWYIRTTAIKDRMVELNNTINWVPETIKQGRFGNWLKNNIDWALSRERFWGTPLPVWTDGEGEMICIGSVAQLEELCGRSISDIDLHRPSIDEITFEKDGKTFKRVPEVIDCWFDSGAMSYAQWHYPFENKEEFEQHFPADYICEAIDQTRGWFYTLHAIASLVSDSVAYKNVICLSHIVDEHGKKMSKSLGNIINPYDVFDSVGADPLRWYFLARIAPEGQKRISVDIVADVASNFINTLWNTYAFFIMYAKLDNIDLKQPVNVEDRPEIDRWALALLHKTVAVATDAMDNYDAKAAGEAIENFVDQLSNWYIRRNRRRFWKAKASDDKQSAYLTLYECLQTIQKLIAPFMPFLAEKIYQNLSRNSDEDAPESVHLVGWPQIDANWKNDQLVDEFDHIQRIVYLGRAAREQSKVKVRQPLARLLLRAPSQSARKAAEKHQTQLLEELNVKNLEFIAADAALVQYRIKPNLPKIGKLHGKQIPAIKQALLDADGREIAACVAQQKTFELELGDQTLEFSHKDVLIETESAEGYSCAESNGFLVGLDTKLNEPLIREGLARELVRTIQDARKQAGLDVSDRIELAIEGDETVLQAVEEFKSYILEETLSDTLTDMQKLSKGYKIEKTLDEHNWLIKLVKSDN